MTQETDVVIVSALRTPFGKFGGSLREIPSSELGATVIRAVVDRLCLKKSDFDEVYYGTCMPAETALEGNIPARQAILRAGLAPTTISVTVDRACCSSMLGVQLGARAIRANSAATVLALGAENMSRLPLLLPSMRFNFRLGHRELIDPLYALGYPDWNPVSVDASEVAAEEGIGRQEQDEWALRSQQQYQQAKSEGFFDNEIVPIEIPAKHGAPAIFREDEFPRPDTTMEKLASLPTVYGTPTVTAGNAPGLDSGAAAVALMQRAEANRRGLRPLGRIVAAASIAAEARLMAKVPAWAIQAALHKAGLSLAEMERIEINEAFAAVPLVSSKLLGEGDRERIASIRARLNVNGGAIAIGHPVGASGARLVLTLLHELRRSGGQYGVAAICGGLAQGDAVIVASET